MPSETINYRGTDWRGTSDWKDTGGEDGVSWVVTLEWRNESKGDIYHTEEAWTEEMKRPIPEQVRKWKAQFTIRTCPEGCRTRAYGMCRTCRMDHLTRLLFNI
jgi:hypothetical protein